MAKKYYAVRVGRKPGIYDNWDDAKEQVNGFKNSKYKSFTTEEEAIAFMNENTQNKIENVVNKKETKKIAIENENKKIDSKAQISFEEEMIKNGSWEEYLFENITCEDLKGYDALCVSDASECVEDKSGSFGLIIIPLKDGKRCDDVIVESALLKDLQEGNGEICEGKFERKRFDLEGKATSEEIILETDLWQKGGYVATGYADRAESESTVRVLELCAEKGYTNIFYISDCQPLLQAINKGASNAVGNMRILRTKGNISMELRKVGSHNNSYIGNLNDVGKDADNKSTLGKSHARIFYLLNDLTDLMAKAEVPPKSGSATSENKVSIHLIPDENGKYTATGMKSDIQKIYEELDCETRRKVTREMIKRAIPLIDKALENSQVKR